MWNEQQLTEIDRLKDEIASLEKETGQGSSLNILIDGRFTRGVQPGHGEAQS